MTAKKRKDVRLQPELIEELNRIAERENRSVSNLIETALKEFVAKMNNKK